MFARIAVGALLLLLAGYGVLKAYPLLTGPELRLESPAPHAHVTDGYVQIAGVAKYTETLLLNGAPLLMEEDGAFEETLLLPSGGAILSLTASDRFGRQVTKERGVFIP